MKRLIQCKMKTIFIHIQRIIHGDIKIGIEIHSSHHRTMEDILKPFGIVALVKDGIYSINSSLLCRCKFNTATQHSDLKISLHWISWIKLFILQFSASNSIQNHAFYEWYAKQNTICYHLADPYSMIYFEFSSRKSNTNSPKEKKDSIRIIF